MLVNIDLSFLVIESFSNDWNYGIKTIFLSNHHESIISILISDINIIMPRQYDLIFLILLDW